MNLICEAKQSIELSGKLSLPDAIRGKSAYELAVMIGFKGTLEEWIDSLKMKYGDLTEEEIAELVASVADNLSPKVAEIKNELIAAVAGDADRAEAAQAAAEAAQEKAETAAKSALSSYADVQISARLVSDHKDEANTAKTAAETAQAAAERSKASAEAVLGVVERMASTTAGYRDEAFTYKNAAAASESNAKTSETNAKKSENNAKTSETNSKASENNAKTSENNANASALQARNYATSANTAKTTAETAQSKAEEAASNAKNAVKASIEQGTGDSTEKTMSQKAITDLVNNLFESLGEAINSAIANATKISTVTLLADGWEGETSPYSQAVTISGTTKNSKIDLNPTIEQLSIFHNKDIAFVVANNDGVTTVYCIGQKPTNNYTIQATITEVKIDG